MNTLKSYYFVLITLSVFMTSCEENAIEKTFTIKGNINSFHQDPKGFKLEVLKVTEYGLTTDYKSLGSTIVDSNNNFSFEYETDLAPSKSITIALDLVNQNGKSVYFSTDFPFASNWTEAINYSYFGTLELTYKSDNPLNIGDSLFIEYSTGRDTLIYPLPNGYTKLYNILNSSQIVAWSRESKKLTPGYWQVINFKASGAPIIDKIELNY